MTADERTAPVMNSGDDRAWQRIAYFALLVESALAQALSEDADVPSDVPGAARLIEAMRYSLRMPGKRLRPLLLLLTADAVGDGARTLRALCRRAGNDSRLLADPRRSAGDGRRYASARPTYQSHRLR